MVLPCHALAGVPACTERWNSAPTPQHQQDCRADTTALAPRHTYVPQRTHCTCMYARAGISLCTTGANCTRTKEAYTRHASIQRQSQGTWHRPELRRLASCPPRGTGGIVCRSSLVPPAATPTGEAAACPLPRRTHCTPDTGPHNVTTHASSSCVTRI